MYLARKGHGNGVNGFNAFVIMYKGKNDACLEIKKCKELNYIILYFYHYVTLLKRSDARSKGVGRKISMKDQWKK